MVLLKKGNELKKGENSLKEQSNQSKCLESKDVFEIKAKDNNKGKDENKKGKGVNKRKGALSKKGAGPRERRHGAPVTSSKRAGALKIKEPTLKDGLKQAPRTLPRKVGICRIVGARRHKEAKRKKCRRDQEGRSELEVCRSMCYIIFFLIAIVYFTPGHLTRHFLCNLSIPLATITAYMFWLVRMFKEYKSDSCRQVCVFSPKRIKTSMVEHERSSWIVSQLTDVTPYWCECPCGRNSRKKTKKNEETKPEKIV